MSSHVIHLQCPVEGCKKLGQLYLGNVYTEDFDDALDYEGEHIEARCDEHATTEIPERRTLTLDIDTGAWVSGGPISNGDGLRLAQSVLPGMPIEELDRAYSAWMNADPAPGTKE